MSRDKLDWKIIVMLILGFLVNAETIWFMTAKMSCLRGEPKLENKQANQCAYNKMFGRF